MPHEQVYTQSKLRVSLHVSLLYFVLYASYHHDIRCYAFPVKTVNAVVKMGLPFLCPIRGPISIAWVR